MPDKWYLMYFAGAAEAKNGVLRMSLQQEVPFHMFTLPRVWEQVRCRSPLH